MNRTIIYINPSLLGYYKDNEYHQYSKEERKEMLKALENEIRKKDSNRKLSSLIIFIILAVLLIVMTTLMILKVINFGENQWTLYIFIVALYILAWVGLYYLVGFILFRRIKLEFYFRKNNESLRFASSQYSKFINQYYDLVSTNTFVKSGLSLKVPKGMENPIFNGKIIANVPYYYVAISSKRVIFLPGFIIYIDSKNSKVIPLDEFKIENSGTTYRLFNNDEEFLCLEACESFNKNFFYFNY